MALSPRGVSAFEVGTDRPVFCRYQHPAWFASPGSRGDDRFEIVSCVEHLRSRHERSLGSRQICCEVLMKLRGVEVSETVNRLFYRGRLAEITWESLSAVSLTLSGIRHIGPEEILYVFCRSFLQIHWHACVQQSRARRLCYGKIRPPLRTWRSEGSCEMSQLPPRDLIS